VREAILEFRNALKLDPKSAETNYRIAKALTAERKYSDAIFYLRETQRLDPSRTDAALEEAEFLYTEDPKRAGELIKGVIEREPANPKAQVARMELALHQNDSEEALAAAMTALELAPDDPFYQLQLGLVHEARILELRSQGKEPPEELYQAAANAFQKADGPRGSPVARIHLGRTYLRWPGKRDLAVAALRSAIELANKRGNRELRLEAAGSAMAGASMLNDSELGLYALEQLVAADESNLDNWVRLARLRQARDEGGDAVFRELVQKRPDDMDAQWRYATWLLLSGRGEEASANLKALTEIPKSRARALEMLSGLQLQMNQPDQAKETLATLQKEFPGTPARSSRLRGRSPGPPVREGNPLPRARRKTGIGRSDAPAGQLRVH
jgi:tetratricopeptide (TPR) repeat protein